MLRILRLLSLPLAIGAAVGLAGCGGTNNAPTPTPTTATATTSGAAPAKPVPDGKDVDHGHKATAHGGIIVPIGRDNYHGEAVFEKEGVVRFFTLGQDEAKVVEADAEPLTAYAKAESGAEATPIVFKAEPQPGDAAGKTSQFVGKLPRDLWGKKVEVTIPTIRIGGERFRVGFSSTLVAHADPAQSGKAADAEERKLYLTPGGKYTAADIAANGNKVASEKFRSVAVSHDLKPKAGDRICPITLTKANPAFAWVIGGQEYQFCCPPCVDEFVQLAKDHPDQIKLPVEYVKK